MAEILSQSQIDELLKNLTSGEVALESVESNLNEKKVKEYDFRSPKKFTREQLKIVNSIYENYSRVLSSYLSGILRVYCEASVLQIEEQKYYEFNNALDDSVLMGNLSIQYPEDEDIDEHILLMEVSRPISYAVIDRLLGGRGTGHELSREYTEIEIAILENLFRQIVPLMKDSWSNYFTIEPSLTRLEMNSRLLQSIGADETVLIIIMDVKVEGLEGKINICLPGVNLEGLLKKLDSKEWRKQKKGEHPVDEKEKGIIFSSVKEGELDIRAELGSTTLSLVDVLNLNVGDIIELDQHVDTLITLKVGEKPWFIGDLGTKRNKKAIRISDSFEKRGKV